MRRVPNVFQSYLTGTDSDVSKEEYIDFIKRAVVKGTSEYRHLYFFLLKCFLEADTHKVAYGEGA